MKKYNIAINVLFWFLVIALVVSATILLNYKNEKVISFINKYIIKPDKVVVVKKEPVYIPEVQEIETEWFYFVATGYSSDDPSQGTDSTTATGKEIKEGMIAVDPKIIPLGTNIEIKNLGLFIAEDTGSKIKGNRIDIYFDTKEEAEEFGRKGVWIKIFDGSYELADIFENIYAN